LKRKTFNHERDVSPRIKREPQPKREVSTCDGLRIATNPGMLNAIPGTLPKLEEAEVFC